MVSSLLRRSALANHLHIDCVPGISGWVGIGLSLDTGPGSYHGSYQTTSLVSYQWLVRATANTLSFGRSQKARQVERCAVDEWKPARTVPDRFARSRASLFIPGPLRNIHDPIELNCSCRCMAFLMPAHSPSGELLDVVITRRVIDTELRRASRKFFFLPLVVDLAHAPIVRYGPFIHFSSANHDGFL
jgi:hypothetical protein